MANIWQRQRSGRITSADLLKKHAGGVSQLVADDFFEAPTATNRTLTASGGSYALTGASATLTKTGGSANYSITALGGSYSVTGQQATVKLGKRVTASGGSYSVAGASATLTKSSGSTNYSITALGGSYAVAGQQATVKLGKRITATGGSYSVTGAQATVGLGKRLTASGGVYTLTGGQATVRRSRLLAASGGAYSISGASATLEIPSGPSNYSITAQGGGYVVSTSLAGIYVSGVSDTTGSRLVSLSGLAGVSAAAHLLAIRLSGATAGAILVSRSTLGSASALAHLLDGGGKKKQEGDGAGRARKWYVRRGRKLHVFDAAQDADAFIEAERIAEEIVAKAKSTSRQARKRLREKVYKPLPAQTVDTDRLAQLVSHFSISVDFPALIAQQDWDRVLQIMAIALQLQDDEDIEILLMA